MEEEILQGDQDTVEVELSGGEEAAQGEEGGSPAGVADAPGEEGAPEDAEPHAAENPPQGMQEEQRRQFLAQQAREQAERARAHQAEIDAAYERAYAGQGDPYHNGRPIRSQADYEAYIAARNEDERRQRMAQMQESGVDADLLQELIRDAVDANPLVRQAGQVVQQAGAAMEQAERERVRGTIESELQRIGAIDASVKTADDLRERYPDTWDHTLELCRRGVPLSEAFKVANFDTLMARRGAAGRQEALNASASKAHLKSARSNGQGVVTMPRDVLEEFRRINPGHSDAEYAQYWARNHKEE